MLRKNVPSQAAEKADELLPLDLPERTVVLSQNGQLKRHIFRRIEAADWDAYFSRCVSELKRDAQDLVPAGSFDDDNAAALYLYQIACVRVEGYSSSDSSLSKNDGDWQGVVPRRHKLTAVSILTTLNRNSDSTFPVIRFAAMWSEVECGLVNRFENLVHRFAAPGDAHLARYAAVRNRPFAASGFSSGKIVVNWGADVMADLYDELIEGVDGYSVGGRPLGDKSQIVLQMDRYHKAYAASELFKVARLVGRSGGR